MAIIGNHCNFHEGTLLHARPATLILSFFILAMSFMVTNADAKSLDWYRQYGVTVSNPPVSDPMSFIGVNEEPSGFIIDYWKKWSQETRIPVSFLFLPWAETLEAVRTGKADIHGGLFFSEERNQYLDFSTPYYTLQAALLVVEGQDADIETIYESYTIGVLDKGYAQKFLGENHPETKLRTYPSTQDIAKALAAGEIVAVAGDHPMMGYQVGKFGIANKLIVKKFLYERKLFGATSKGNKALLRLINEGMARIDTNEHEEIVKRWFVAEPDNMDWNRLVIASIILLGLGLLGLFVSDRLFVRKGSKRP